MEGEGERGTEEEQGRGREREDWEERELKRDGGTGTEFVCRSGVCVCTSV